MWLGVQSNGLNYTRHTFKPVVYVFIDQGHSTRMPIDVSRPQEHMRIHIDSLKFSLLDTIPDLSLLLGMLPSLLA